MVSHEDTPIGLFRACLGNLHYEDCRVLKTAIGAADYFPEGFLFRPHPATKTQLTQVSCSTGKKGKKIANAIGLAYPPIGVFSTVTDTLTLPSTFCQAEKRHWNVSVHG